MSNIQGNGHISVTFTYHAPQPTTWTITASAGSGGSISPSGSVSVQSGYSKQFTITPNTGYRTNSLKLDNISQSGWSNVSGNKSYTISNVTANHTLAVTFTNNVAMTINPNGGTLQYKIGTGSYTQITSSTNITVHTGDSLTIQYLLNPTGKVWKRFETQVSYNTIYSTSYTESSQTYNFTVPTSFTDGGVSYTPDTVVINAAWDDQPIYVNASREGVTDLTYKVKIGSASAVTVNSDNQVITSSTVAGTTITITDITSASHNFDHIEWQAVDENGNTGQVHTPTYGVSGASFVIPIQDYYDNNTQFVVFGIEITVMSTIKTFTITTTVTPSGGGTISPTNPTVTYGSNQTFTVTPSTGYRIDNVKLDGSDIQPDS